MKIQNKHVIAWLESCAAHLTEQQDFLTALDRDIGDADHGLNMNRGFSAVKATLPDIERQHIGNILKNTGMKLLSSVGGASGPLYGTLFIRASAAVGARTELTLEEWLACLEALSHEEKQNKGIKHCVMSGFQFSTKPKRTCKPECRLPFC